MTTFNPVKEKIFTTAATIPAGTEIDLGNDWDMMEKILSARVVTLSDGTNPGSITELSITTAPPGAGQIQQVDNRSIILGDDLTPTQMLILRYLPMDMPSRLITV